MLVYPRYALPFHTVTWCSSGPRDLFAAIQMTKIAADLGRDVVHVAFSLEDDEPLGVSLAVRRAAGIEWLPACSLYAASENSQIELLTRDARWFVGPGHDLTSAKLPPKARREHGEEIAWRRWRQHVETLGGLNLQGSVWVPQGGEYADAIAFERLKVTT